MRPSSVDIALATRHASLISEHRCSTWPLWRTVKSDLSIQRMAGRLSMPKDRTLAPSEAIRIARQASCQGRFFPSPQISNVGLIIRFRIQCSARNRAILMR
jgi:hypothetical protein